jgi:aspartate ammonia-lyase
VGLRPVPKTFSQKMEVGEVVCKELVTNSSPKIGYLERFFGFRKTEKQGS